MGKKKKEKEKAGPRLLRIFIGFIIGGLLADITLSITRDGSGKMNITDVKKMDEMPYKDFEKDVYGTDTEVFYANNSEYMYFQDKDGKYWKVLFPGSVEWRAEAIENGVKLRTDNTTTTGDAIMLIISLIPPILLGLLLLTTVKRFSAMSSAFSSGGAIKPESSDTKFSDVIGHEEVVEDIKFIVQLLKDPTLIQQMGGRIPKGILFQGPPGTGKTLLAKAIAGEAGVPFFYSSASRFKELFVGNGAKNVRALFDAARKSAPCVVFIDEIDAIGGKREGTVGDQESTQTIDELLTQLDGFKGNEGVFVIAATNTADKLDTAITRAGRFDKHVTIAPPRDWHVRLELLKHYFKDIKLSSDVQVDEIAKQTVGFTGADIAATCNESAIVALQHQHDYVTSDDVEEAIDRRVFKGNRSKREQAKSEKSRVAKHEAGHALMTVLCNEPLSRASIQSTTSGVGGAVFGADNDDKLHTRSYYENHVRICYAGYIAEEILLGEPSLGASNDIEQATEIILSYVGGFGFDPEVGLLSLSVLRMSSVVNRDVIQKRCTELAKTLYAETKDILTSNKAMLKSLADVLEERETLSRDEILEIITVKPVVEETHLMVV